MGKPQESKAKFRHEMKHRISYMDMLTLKSRLSAVMQQDSHAVNGKYEIRSLYFDTIDDKALREKIDGVNIRDKYRLRYYNGDTSFIVLEKKSKVNGLCLKKQQVVSVEEVNQILSLDTGSMEKSGKDLLAELAYKMVTEGLRPMTIVDYTRYPFIYAPGNVRVTLDFDIRTGLKATDFLDRDCVTIPTGDDAIILEVKWDEFLPTIIRDIVQLPGTRTSSYSKYAACRLYA